MNQDPQIAEIFNTGQYEDTPLPKKQNVHKARSSDYLSMYKEQF